MTLARMPEEADRLIRLRQQANSRPHSEGEGARYREELAYRTALWTERYGELRLVLDALVREVAEARDALERERVSRRGYSDANNV